MDSPQNSLIELLSDPDITAQHFFSQEGIVAQVKSKIQVFIDFCIRNQNFTQQMIKLGLQVSQHSSEESRKICYVAGEILTYDNDAISELFVIDKSKERIRLYSDDQEQCQEIICDETGQLTVVERLTSQQKSDFIYKYRNLIFLLEYLNKINLDENCVNYTAKVLFTIIRIKPEDMFQFFHERVDVLKKMIQLTCYPSISFALVKLLNEVDEKKYRKQKQQIINIMLKQIRAQISNQNFTNYLQFIEDVFNKNRFRGEEIDEIKIISQELVQKEIVDFMKEKISEEKQNKVVICNCIAYLLKVVERMNVDEEKDPYFYSDDKTLEPTMNFAFESLYSIFGNLISLSSIINRKSYTSLEILTFYQLLDGLTKNSRFLKMNLTNSQRSLFVVCLLKAYENQNPKANGLIKFEILKILERIIKLEPVMESFNDQTMKIIANIYKDQIHESLSYNEKLKVLMQKEQISGCLEKYSGILSPNNYTSNREFKILQFNFIYQKKKKLENESGKNVSDKPEDLPINNNILDCSDLVQAQDASISKVSSEESSNKPEQLNSKSPINILKLDNKINQIKMKRRSKQTEEQSPIFIQADDKEIPRKLPVQSPQKVKNGVNSKIKIEEETTNSACSKPKAAEYYVKHIILF